MTDFPCFRGLSIVAALEVARQQRALCGDPDWIAPIPKAVDPPLLCNLTPQSVVAAFNSDCGP